VMLVSHDRALLREVCDEFWLVTAGAVKPFDGDLDDYQRWLLEQSKAAARERSAGSDERKRRTAEEAKPKAANAPAASGKPAAQPTPAPAPVPPKRREDRQAAAQARQQRDGVIRPLRKELSLVDNRLGVLFAEREKIEASLADPATTPTQLADGGKRLKAIGEQIETLEARWLDLSTQIDQLAESPG